MKYRREIDGLRAVAVLPVILFHAGFAAFRGGFVGVDIFFVISGYLITTIILSEKENNSFSLVKFYERRARRILPALFFVMICCFPFAWLWLPPNHLKNFSESVLAISGFASNFLFWKESGYFAAAAELKPLLHTWSLAVEEQYYLLFPLFIILMWKVRKKWIFGSLLAVAFASLALAQWGAYHDPSAAFFLLPARGWELAIGALIAFYFLYRKDRDNFVFANRAVSEALGLFGMALICYSVFAFDQSTPFPSLYTLIPTLGTALIIIFTSPGTLVGRFLGTRIMVGIGLISYSTYLWHQPLFVFARHRSTDQPGIALLLALAALSIVLAYLSWRFVEKPFRDRNTFSKKRIFTFAAAGSLFFATAGLTGHLMDGMPGRIGFSKDLMATFERSSSPCFDKENIHIIDDWYCGLGKADSEPSFFVFGDSHAVSLFDAFDSASRDAGLSGIFTGASGCTPFLGIHALRKDQDKKNCYELNRRVYDFAAKNRIKSIFLIGRWSYYTDGGYSGDDFSYIGRTDHDEKNRESSREAFEYGFNKTVDEYRKIGVKVYILSDVPEQMIEPENAYLKAYMFRGEEIDKVLRQLSVPYDNHLKLNEYATGIFTKNPLATVLNFDGILCNPAYCPIGTKTTSYYFDDDHLSSAGAKTLVPDIEETLLQTTEPARSFDIGSVESHGADKNGG